MILFVNQTFHWYDPNAYTVISYLAYAEQNATCRENKAGYTATEVASGWAGAVIKMANQAFGQEG